MKEQKNPHRLHSFFWFCCNILNTKDQFDKFDSKFEKGIFLGCSSISKACSIYNSSTLVVEETRDFKFDYYT